MFNGTLALTGSGEYLPPMEPVDRFLLKQIQGSPRVVCLPTAAGTEGEEMIRHWGDLGVEHFRRLGVEAEAVPVIDRASAADESLAGNIRAANFVYFSGGNPVYLYRTLTGTPVHQAVMGVLEKGGVVAGCSAGAMIWGRRATPFPWHPGFGLLPDSIIMPHYDELSAAMTGAIKWLFVPARTLIGVEGNTALVCQNSTYRVVGSGGVTIWNHRGKRRYGDGEVIEGWR